MKVGIMQPYLFPYIGYFQLINHVDVFVIYDNIEYTKKGWINRNRILVNGKDSYFTIPISKGSDFLQISERVLTDDYKKQSKKLLNKLEASYRKAPYFIETFPLLKNILKHEETNLFKFIHNALQAVLDHLNIKTKIQVSSEIDIDHTLRSQDKVIAICKVLNANCYVNPIGGAELYNKKDFKRQDIDLHFLKSDEISYKQFDNDFIPWLSIIDVMMFNSIEQIQTDLNNYVLY